ncbi:hypothetical protein PHMEG_00010227 [Phytophthora megakarya]|uniref:Uncharacterized protein n=1 Tax=Phytophthora megakarya TaxID=4795 RepID=A0A225WG92_9STRA|nr:hypothetical protein PHMEG_00010227 [Phytophthora megakarya]
MGHPDLTRLLTHPGVSIFIDGTFSTTLKPFKQTITVKCHDPSYDVYITWAYWHCLEKLKMTTASITCDFDTALINAVRNQFQGT